MFSCQYLIDHAQVNENTSSQKNVVNKANLFLYDLWAKKNFTF